MVFLLMFVMVSCREREPGWPSMVDGSGAPSRAFLDRFVSMLRVASKAPQFSCLALQSVFADFGLWSDRRQSFLGLSSTAATRSCDLGRRVLVVELQPHESLRLSSSEVAGRSLLYQASPAPGGLQFGPAKCLYRQGQALQGRPLAMIWLRELPVLAIIESRLCLMRRVDS